jgi:uncharacterized protein YutE (UPF0331/DUF86 family)
MNDVVLNKKESIERCVRQARNYYALSGGVPFMRDYLRQDAIALNLQRAVEQSIDLANSVVREKKLGLPKTSRESFRLLAENGIIPERLASTLERMVGFRNVLVHQYQKLDIAVMIDIIEHRLDDVLEFTDYIVKAVGD